MSSLFSMGLPLGFLPSGGEWFWIFLIIFLLFGPKRLPEIAKIFGRWGREIQRAKLELENEIERAMKEGESDTASDPEISKEKENWKDEGKESG